MRHSRFRPIQGFFLSDAEGPDVATWGNTIGLAYQIAGQQSATGAQYMVSEDGGVLSPSYDCPNATEDHFMPSQHSTRKATRRTQAR